MAALGRLSPLIYRIWGSVFSKGDAQLTGLGGNLRLPSQPIDATHALNRSACKSEKSRMNLKSIITFTLLLSMCSGLVFAAKVKEKNKDKQLPQGLQMKLDRGGSLPPGWQKKLVKGEILGNQFIAIAK
jgi:hypothetical protein